MITLGIISVQEKKSGLLKRILKKQRIKCGFGENPHFVVCEIYVNPKNEKRNIKACEKAERFLKKQGAEAVFLTKEVKNSMGIGNSAVRSVVPKDDIINTYLWAAEKSEDKFCQKLLIADKELKAVSVKALSRLCLKVKEMVVYTKCVWEMEKIAENIFREYGLWIDVKGEAIDYDEIKPSMRWNIIDVDNGFVRVKDFVVDGVVYDIDAGNYNVDKNELGEYLKDRLKPKIKSRLSGKNIFEIC